MPKSTNNIPKCEICETETELSSIIIRDHKQKANREYKCCDECLKTVEVFIKIRQTMALQQEG